MSHPTLLRSFSHSGTIPVKTGVTEGTTSILSPSGSRIRGSEVLDTLGGVQGDLEVLESIGVPQAPYDAYYLGSRVMTSLRGSLCRTESSKLSFFRLLISGSRLLLNPILPYTDSLTPHVYFSSSFTFRQDRNRKRGLSFSH